MNHSHGHEMDIGGVVYLLNHAGTYIPYLLLQIVGFIVGFIGNILIMSAILLTKELHNSTNMLIFNLSLADFCISTFIDGFTIMTIFVGKKFFDKIFAFCEFIGSLCLILCATSMVNIGFLSINRYISICHHRLYDKAFTKNRTILYCFVTWVVGILVDLPCVLGWGGHTFNVNTLNCVWDRTANKGYTLFFPLSTIVIPCCCIAVCYFKIYLFVVKSKSKVHAVSSTKPAKKFREASQSIRMAKSLFASFSLFTLCWIPYGVVVIADWYFTFPVASEVFTMILAHLNSAANPILYAIYNPSFRRGYKNVFYIVTRRKIDLKKENTHRTDTVKTVNTVQETKI